MARKRKREEKMKVKLAAAFAVIVLAAFAAHYFGFFTLDDWKNLIGVRKTAPAEGEVQVHYINVGQGDSSLIISGDDAILIDTGEKEYGETVCTYLESQGIDSLDCLILTHPHSDHMGAASYIIDNTDIESIVIPRLPDDLVPTTKVYESFLESVSAKGLKLEAAEPGMTMEVGDGTLEIISPVKEYDDLNNFSAASVLTHGENSFLFTGDLEKKAEKDIIEAGGFTDIDVLKVAHHGSNTSSCDDFLSVVTPEYAVIECGDNSYNHPHEETVTRIGEYTDKIYRTDIDGTVVFKSADNKLEIVTEN